MSENIPTIAAVRGAIQVAENRADLVQAATARLLTALLERNALRPEQIVSAIFTATPDLDSDFPAHAARRLGWTDVPLLGAMEMAVPGALPRVVRVLLTVSRMAGGGRLTPVYLEGAAALRPDLANAPVAPRAPRSLAIIGLGQIGGSIGLALAGQPQWRRAGFDLDRDAAARALAAGAVDRVGDSVGDACRDAGLAVIATPVDAIPGGVREAAEALPRGAALLDTGSTRRGITEALREAAGRGVLAIGGHPLAGNEGHGFASAHADLFRDTRFVLCPLEGVVADSNAATGEAHAQGSLASGVPQIALELLADLGARPVIVTPGEHDDALARTSHLPFLLARALRTCGATAQARGLSGPAFRDMTRVARGDPRVAEAYCRANLAQVRAAWERFHADIEAQIAALAAAPKTNLS